jgi:WD40 repeat protein
MTKVKVNKVHTLSGHKDCIYTLQSGNSPEMVFSGAGDGMVVLWDLKQPESGQLIARLPNSIYALHYLKTQDLLVVGHNYDGIHLLDWREKKEIKSLQLTTAAIFDIVSHADQIFVASGDGSVTVVDGPRWAIKHRMVHSDKSARAIAINSFRGELAVAYSDYKVRVFDLDTYDLKYEWMAHQNSVFTVAYSVDGRILLTGSRDARLKAWNAENQYVQVAEVVAHLYTINHVAFSPDGKHFVTCSLDKSIKVWELEGFKLIKVIDKARHAGHGTSVNKLLWTSFNDQLLSASDDRTISIWNIIF